PSPAPSVSKPPFPPPPTPNLTPPEQATKQPDPHRPFHPAPLHCARCCRAPSRGSIFGSVTIATASSRRQRTLTDGPTRVRHAVGLAVGSATWRRGSCRRLGDPRGA